jgi:hypothetical protein
MEVMKRNNAMAQQDFVGVLMGTAMNGLGREGEDKLNVQEIVR